MTMPLSGRAAALALALLPSTVSCGGSPGPSGDTGAVQEGLCTGVKIGAPESVAAGGSVTLTASNATCGAGEVVQYRFSAQLPGTTGSYRVVRDWGSAATASWSTAGLSSGEWKVSVEARATGATKRESRAYAGVVVGAHCKPFLGHLPGHLHVNRAAPGSVVVIGSGATCWNGAAPEIELLATAPGATVPTVLRGWTPRTVASVPDYSWNTTGLATGTYTLTARARVLGTTTVTGAATSTFDLGEQCYLADCTEDCGSYGATPSGPVPSGTPVTLEAQFLRCTGDANPEYRFVLKSPVEPKTRVLRDFAPSPTMIWDTAALPDATYIVTTEVRANDLPGAATDHYNVQYTLGGFCREVGLDRSGASSMPAGSTIDFTASATCQVGMPEYQFVLLRDSSGDHPTEIRGWGGPTFTWDTTGTAPGPYKIFVYSRAEGSLATKQGTARVVVSLSPGPAGAGGASGAGGSMGSGGASSGGASSGGASSGGASSGGASSGGGGSGSAGGGSSACPTPPPLTETALVVCPTGQYPCDSGCCTTHFSGWNWGESGYSDDPTGGVVIDDSGANYSVVLDDDEPRYASQLPGHGGDTFADPEVPGMVSRHARVGVSPAGDSVHLVYGDEQYRHAAWSAAGGWSYEWLPSSVGLPWSIRVTHMGTPLVDGYVPTITGWSPISPSPLGTPIETDTEGRILRFRSTSMGHLIGWEDANGMWTTESGFWSDGERAAGSWLVPPFEYAPYAPDVDIEGNGPQADYDGWYEKAIDHCGFPHLMVLNENMNTIVTKVHYARLTSAGWRVARLFTTNCTWVYGPKIVAGPRGVNFLEWACGQMSVYSLPLH